MRSFWPALVELQVLLMDMLQLLRTAAHDITQEDLFSSIGFMSL